MEVFAALKAKKYSYLTDNDRYKKKQKHKKVCRKKKKHTFEDYKNCLEATQLGNKINHLEKMWKLFKKIIKNS